MLSFVVDQTMLQMAVRTLTLIATQGTVMASKEGVKLIARWPEDYYVYDFFAVLSLSSLDFIHFYCTFASVTGVNLECLMAILGMIVGDALYEQEGEGFIWFNALDYQRRARLTFINNRPHVYPTQQIDLHPPDHAAVERYLRESQREYCVVAAVPSTVFRFINRLLFDLGDKVTITITQTKVVFSVLRIRVTLRKERLECIIGATSAEDYPAQVIIDTDFARPFMHASYLSNMVWILHCADPIALHKFIIPLGATGKFMFYTP